MFQDPRIVAGNRRRKTYSHVCIQIHPDGHCYLWYCGRGASHIVRKLELKIYVRKDNSLISEAYLGERNSWYTVP